MKKELFVVIAYDIVSDKRRKKVVNRLRSPSLELQRRGHSRRRVIP